MEYNRLARFNKNEGVSNMTDLQKLQKYFTKEFIMDVKKDFEELKTKMNFSHPSNEVFFTDTAKYTNKNKVCRLSSEIDEYFDYLFWAPNIALLLIVIDDLEYFRKKTFLDNGSGFGALLSVFLQKLGVNCVNYDNQRDWKYKFSNDLKEENFYKKYNISPPIKDVSEILHKIDILSSCGIYITNEDMSKKDYECVFHDNAYYRDYESIKLQEKYYRSDTKHCLDVWKIKT